MRIFALGETALIGEPACAVLAIERPVLGHGMAAVGLNDDCSDLEFSGVFGLDAAAQDGGFLAERCYFMLD